ncbi:hypothetical protein GCM10022205_05200 [Spinactinospora alkalitolerans]
MTWVKFSRNTDVRGRGADVTFSIMVGVLHVVREVEEVPRRLAPCPARIGGSAAPGPARARLGGAPARAASAAPMGRAGLRPEQTTDFSGPSGIRDERC